MVVWALSSGRVVSELRSHKFGVACVAWSPDGARLVSVGFRHDKTLLLWDWRDGGLVAKGKVSQRVHAVAFARDGSFFVSCGERHVKWWDVPDVNQVTAHTNH